MKHLKINVPEGYEIDKENSTFEEIVFKPVAKQLPKTWEELNMISGYFVCLDSSLSKIRDVGANGINKNIFVTEEQAEASKALAQLSQLREVYRQGWTPDWDYSDELKYCIVNDGNNLISDWSRRSTKFLSFQTKEICDLFLENFRELIEKALPFML